MSRTGFASASALMVADEHLRIRSWNAAAEELTGIPAAEAVGQPCWLVLAGRDDDGATVCHQACATARGVRQGRCALPLHLTTSTAEGPRRLSVETVLALGGDEPLLLHLLRDAPRREPEALEPPPHLTPRQWQVLTLLSAGKAAKLVAVELGLREATVRNHIRMLLRALGVHSQLEAVAFARKHDLVREIPADTG